MRGCSGQGGGDIYVAFNAHHFAVQADLPPPMEGHQWARLVDTNLVPPKVTLRMAPSELDHLMDLNLRGA